MTTSYDAAGNVLEQSNPRTGSFAMRQSFDDLNRAVSHEDGESDVALKAYDEVGNPVCEKQPLGAAGAAVPPLSGATVAQLTQAVCTPGYLTTHAYDELNKLTRTTDATGGRWDFIYDAARNLVAKVDANRHYTSYEHDSLSQRTAEHQHFELYPGFDRSGVILASTPVDPTMGTGSLDWNWRYDANQNMQLATDPKGQVKTWTYGILNRLSDEGFTASGARELPALDAIHRDYDGNGNTTNLVETKETLSGIVQEPAVRLFDNLDRLQSEQRYDGKVVSYDYSPHGERKTVTDPDGVATSYTYDHQNRLATATLDGGKTTSYGYWPDSLLQTTAMANGVTETRSYDKASRLLGIASAVLVLAYSYDANANRLSTVEQRTDVATQTLLAPETTTYGYDQLDRLTGVAYPDSHAVLYQFDPVGNRIGERATLPGTNTGLGPEAFAAAPATSLSNDWQSTFDAADRLVTRFDAQNGNAGARYVFDLNGNLTTKQTLDANGAGTTRQFSWDVRNTLTAVFDDGAEVGRYDYNRDLQRVKRKSGTQQIEVVLDGKYVLNEADATGIGHPSLRRYHYGNQPLAETEIGGSGAATTFLSVDALGSVVAQTALDGSVAAGRQYDAYGQYRNGTAPAASGTLLGYTGHQYSAETGLTYARARWLDNGTGNLLSRDSYAGSFNDVASLHRYAYVRGNPLRYTDPDGRCYLRRDGSLDCQSYGLHAAQQDLDRAGGAFSRGAYADAAIETIKGATDYGAGMLLQFPATALWNPSNDVTEGVRTKDPVRVVRGATVLAMTFFGGEIVEAAGGAAFSAETRFSQALAKGEGAPRQVAAGASRVQARTALEDAAQRASTAGENGALAESWAADVFAPESASAASTPSTAGPVAFRPPPGATPEQVAQVEAYIDCCNRALAGGQLSPTGRVSTKGDLKREASLAAKAERARAEAAGTPYEGVAGHGPDTTWTGNPNPPEWLDLDAMVNSSLGGQANGYPVGYKPTSFGLKKPEQ